MLDLNGDGVVNNGSELFGNHSQTPDGSQPLTGYGVLALYDLEVWGGHEDDVIDARDSIFGRLRVWIDFDHDGTSGPQELFSLHEVGISGLGFDYRQEEIIDGRGSLLYYWCWADQEVRGSRIRRLQTVDAIFVHED